MTLNPPAISQKGVPGVPLSALDAITDPNVRQVLRAIVDGWNVRNGTAGKGDARFVTAGELGSVQGAIGGLQRSLQAIGAQDRRIDPSDINRVINDLQAQVMESLLFKQLGERITLIETTGIANGNAISQEITNRSNADNAIYSEINTQVSRIDGNVAALQTQQTTTANNVAALSSTVTTVQAQTDSNTAAIQTEATARTNADNDIYAKYSVKIDVNGYVSGFGLISTANNAAPYSDFIVRADRFAIGSPSGPGITPKVPFVVLTTPDGNGTPAGVYLDYGVIRYAAIGTAQIANAAITSAKIGDAEVGTLKIAGNAVTVPQVSSSAGNSASTSITLAEATVVMIWGVCSGVYLGTGGRTMKITVDGADVKSVYSNSSGGVTPTIVLPIVHHMSLAAGTHTITASVNEASTQETTVIVMAAKR